jgi:MYXO-CTERM domain-containing protein
LVDGVIVDTQQTNSSGRFDFKGAMESFDTTTLANGPHELKLVVFDSSSQSAASRIEVTVANQAVVVPDGGGTVIPPGTDDGGCGCSAAKSQGGAGAVLGALMLGALVFGLTRRSRR